MVSIFIVASIANPWVVIPAILTLVSLILFRQYFIVASRKIKRLEALGMIVVSSACNYILVVLLRSS